ncbi:diguanylate cyclase [Echinimonas agarilytica]|uniref:Diguanylate cyclase n=1 Tax=Echinimonas agarilytica TaxID=1215918 RepID=A0AA42B8U6_9GAMM|nr:diguanylate cyclase [Echinimonas agarilytica]MCM2680873.1 diguanylate cyclase [Echinimonas agarilytica]
MNLKSLRVTCLILCLGALFVPAHARTVLHNNDPAAKEQYLVGMLQLALQKSGTDFTPKPLDEVLTEAKTISEVEAGSVDVYWGTATKENETRFTPIRIPLAKGLLGYRLFIIKKGEQHKFDHIENLHQLKLLSAGQGRTWGDTKILSNANIPLETSVKYENLFYMLEGGRFDYFPRAAHEPWSEISTYAKLDLTVEKHLMLVYPFAMYFYVNQANAELAEAIETGLETAISDGSFDAYFYSNPLIQSALNDSNLKSRKRIEIDNPFLPEATPLARQELWLDVAAIP